jgi:Domain of unknown function (DUF4365)
VYITQRQEQFSSAYLLAIAAVAGFSLSKPYVDEDSIDFTISGKGRTGIIVSPKLDLQLKCQMNDIPIGEKGFSYPLKIKNYDDLRLTNIQVPRILVVVLVPVDISQWLNHSDTQTIFQYGGYWASLHGLPPTSNKETVSIPIPQQNRLTSDSLTTLMNLIETGVSL